MQATVHAGALPVASRREHFTASPAAPGLPTARPHLVRRHLRPPHAPSHPAPLFRHRSSTIVYSSAKKRADSAIEVTR